MLWYIFNVLIKFMFLCLGWHREILDVVRLAVQAATDNLAKEKKAKLKELVPANQEIKIQVDPQ